MVTGNLVSSGAKSPGKSVGNRRAKLIKGSAVKRSGKSMVKEIAGKNYAIKKYQSVNQGTGARKIFMDQEGRIGVRFPYDARVNEELKQIPNHRWRATGKYWSFPFGYDNYTKVLKVFEGMEIEIDTELKSRFGVNPDRELPSPTAFADSDFKSPSVRLKSLPQSSSVAFSNVVNEKKKEIPQIDEEVIDDTTELRRLMRLRNYSNRTIKSYCSCIRHFAGHGSHSDLKQMTSQEIRAIFCIS
jgi:hypothetical protein